MLKLGWRENITALFEAQSLKMNPLLNLRGHGRVPLQIRLLTFLQWLGCSGSPAFHGTRKVFLLDWYLKNINLTGILKTFVSNEYTTFRKKWWVEGSGFHKRARAPVCHPFYMELLTSRTMWLEMQSPLGKEMFRVMGFGRRDWRTLALVDSQSMVAGQAEGRAQANIAGLLKAVEAC